MSSQLDFTPGDGHETWLTSALANAAAEAGATVAEEPVFGWRDRTIGTPITTARGRRWLRVVSEHRNWVGGDFWTGNTDATNQITGVAKPEVLRHWEWDDGDYRLRAEVMTLLPGRHCSSTPEIRQRLPLPDSWWRQLGRSLTALAQTRTDRAHVSQADIAHRLRVFFGDRVPDPTVHMWTTAHTDLHWANLMAPDCALVDWEGWGMAPAGFDAATLYLHSLLAPEMADEVRQEFAAELECSDGLLAQLFITGRMLLRINSGDYPDLAIPLHHNAERVIGMLSRR